jgi:hypothetical protein
MAVIDELVCPTRGSFSLSTKILSVHVTGNQLSEEITPFPSIKVIWMLFLSNA